MELFIYRNYGDGQTSRTTPAIDDNHNHTFGGHGGIGGRNHGNGIDDGKRRKYPFWDYRFQRDTGLEPTTHDKEFGHVALDDTAQMTSSKQALRHRSQTPEPSLPPDLRTGRISLHVDGNPEELRPFLDLASKVASCFKPNVNIIEKATSSHSPSSSPTSSKTISKVHQSSSCSPLSMPSSSSSSSSSASSTTLSSGSKEGKEFKSHSKNSHHYLESKDSHFQIENQNDYLQNSKENVIISDCFQNSAQPAYTVTVFLRHLDADPSQRLKPNATPRDKRASSLMKILKSSPWDIHHVERVSISSKSKLRRIQECGDGYSDTAIGSNNDSCSRSNDEREGDNGGGGIGRGGEQGGGVAGCNKTNTLTLTRNNSKTNTNNTTSSGNLVQFYQVSPNLPLWSLRQFHHGCEHFRIVLNTPYDLWDDQIKFYSLVLGIEVPDLLREDFCLFTVRKEIGLDYDVQLALKRLPPNASVNVLNGVHIQFKIKDLGTLVALLPNVCQPVSDVLWETTDHLGNRVVFNVVRSKKPRRGSLCLEDAVYECMTLPIFNGLSLNHPGSVFQRVEENSKCTQTSPVLSDDFNNKDNIYDNNYYNDSKSKNDNGDSKKVSGKKKNTTSRPSSRGYNITKNDNNNIIICDDNDEEEDCCVYENCFEAKYDDLDIYVNCDNNNDIHTGVSPTCNFSSSSPSSPRSVISSMTCRVPPLPRRRRSPSHVSECECEIRQNYTTNGDNVKLKDKQYEQLTNRFRECGSANCKQRNNRSKTTMNRDTASKHNKNNNSNNSHSKSAMTENYERFNGNTDGSDYIVATKRPEELCNNNANDSNGYVVLSNLTSNNNNNSNNSHSHNKTTLNGFPMLISDEDFHVDFHRSFNPHATIDSMGKALQEDEESLTLTNLSEESGIIVLHDDDGVWCEEGEGEGDVEGEGHLLESPEKCGHGHNDIIRSCIRKGNGHRNNTSTSSSTSSSANNDNNNNINNHHRNHLHKNGQHNNRKVRFSDEIKSFELEPILDDSQSRLSSGFESDEQSDDATDMMTTTKMMMERKQHRHRKHHYQHQHHHHHQNNDSSRSYSTPTSSRDFSKHPSHPAMIHYSDSMMNEDSVTSFQKGFDESAATSGRFQRTSKNNIPTTGIPGEGLSNCDYNDDENNHHHDTDTLQRRREGTRVQKCHSDVLPSHNHTTKSSSSQRSCNIKGQGRHSVPSTSSSGALFRPICPPSYEMALATKQKIEQDAFLKKNNSTLHFQRENTTDHHHHHHHHHHRHQTHRQHQNNGYYSESTEKIINSPKDNNILNFDNQVQSPSIKKSDNNSVNSIAKNLPNYHPADNNVYTESKKLHTVQHARVVCNNNNNNNDANADEHDTKIKIHRAIPSVSHSHSTPENTTRTSGTSGNKNNDNNNVCSKINVRPYATTENQSTSDVKQNLLTKPKPQTPVGILRKSRSSASREMDVDDERNNYYATTESKDVTTNFTLRFDTCPMSGGQPRKEQTGFYV